MEAKTNTARLLSCIKEALNSSTPGVSIEFVCGTIVLFEKHFGQKNKAAMQKILKEAMENYGPESPFSNNENMLPIYSMLTKYSKSLTVSEIFERLYRKGSYRRCAKFYVEWCRSCREAPKKLEVLDLAFQEKAEPVDVLLSVREEIQSSMAPSSLQDPAHLGRTSPHDSDPVSRKSPAEKSTRRTLFGGKANNVVESKKCSSEKGTSSSSSDFVLPDPGPSSRRTISGSDYAAAPALETSSRRSSDASETLAGPDPNAENINPSGAPTEPTVRRKLAGILVASLDFTLEDYDLSDDVVTNLKSSEMLKREDNEANIRNNMLSEDAEQSGSSFPSFSSEKRLTPSPTNSDHW
ncbi:hypothetical protein Y032_0153g2919 [Ancylostoma ceylanicum]|uniref:BUB1 N-terminal domain-containing protein n=1 Tax=Ancylostoma ceylanicum TaxID=53326 RepID=A0A016T0A3_9BILA|nr:hypothetical protein Y032_0153g2919 [Ancylostoma ceylanicum]